MRTAKELEKYLEMCVAGGAMDAKVIDPRSVVTAPWVRFKCQFGCASYEKSNICPPHTPDYERMRAILDSYSTAILAHFDLPDKVGIIGKKIEMELFYDGYYKAIGFGSGPCRLCTEREVGEPCNGDCPNARRHRITPSMEACGIDVYQTARTNGFTIYPLTTFPEDLHGNYFSLILVE